MHLVPVIASVTKRFMVYVLVQMKVETGLVRLKKGGGWVKFHPVYENRKSSNALGSYDS
jgi:hypothetical protein